MFIFYQPCVETRIKHFNDDDGGDGRHLNML